MGEGNQFQRQLIGPVTDRLLGIKDGRISIGYCLWKWALFNACFRAGFVLDGIEEPGFDDRAQGSRPFSWVNFTQIPPVMVARMRLIE